ncbi:MAG: branched-chain amino acid aminotransferase [Collinsella sp.]
MTVEKKDIDWGSLGFGYMKTDYSYEAHWKDGEWDEGGLTTDHTLHVSECGGIFHYCQEVFEGLKAYTAEDGSIVCFRPDMNAERMYNSAQRLEMPPFPKDKFVEAVKQVVSANAAWVPPFGSGATLYVRPFMIGSGDVIGVAPAPEYTFRILVTPVGPYFKGGLKPVKLRVSEYDRAAPHGTGNIKAGLNYAMSLKPTMEAHREGYAENLYLDSESRTYVEETGGANVLFVKEDGTLVVPQSHTDSILPSITRRSLVQVAQDLGMTVDQRPVEWAEVKAGTFVECGLCGTAAVISPVGEIDNKVYGADETVTFPAGYTEIGPVMKKLRETLTGIQSGAVEDKHNWVYWLFSGTVASNLRFGNEGATEGDMLHALEVAQSTFVLDQPQGLDTPVAQGGTNFSGGQRQRLAIARALMKRADLYIFDDSFSALDFKTDAALRHALQDETRDAAVLIIAQRISTILHADQIVVLKDGEVVGLGTHGELMETCEVYRAIAESQMKGGE